MKKNELIYYVDVMSRQSVVPSHTLEQVEELIYSYARMNSPKMVAVHQDLEEYTNFSVATDVYACEDGFVGISGLVTEPPFADKVKFSCIAKEYAESQTTTYYEI